MSDAALAKNDYDRGADALIERAGRAGHDSADRASVTSVLFRIIRPDPTGWHRTTRLLEPIDPALKTLDLTTYRTLMLPHVWGFIRQAVIATRGYSRGLDAGLLLLRYTDIHVDELPPKEVDRNRMHLYNFVLAMLDRLDQWDAYLAAWHYLRAHTTYSSNYVADAAGRPRMVAYVLAVDGETWRVHFLWSIAHRHEVITRKARKRNHGVRLGNLFHHPQDELTPAEIKRRLDWVVHFANLAWKARRRRSGSADNHSP